MVSRDLDTLVALTWQDAASDDHAFALFLDDAAAIDPRSTPLAISVAEREAWYASDDHARAVRRGREAYWRWAEAMRC